MSNWTPQQVRDYEARMNGTTPELGRAIKAKVEREIELHKQIMAWCDAQWPRWKYIRARSDQPSTIAVGCQDFTIFGPGKVLCVECKRAGAKQDHEQLCWATEMRMLGHTVFVVHSMEEFLKLV